MFSKKKDTPKIDPEQREMYDYARHRIAQKKNLFRHFIVFLAGAVLILILNVALDLGKDIKPFGADWFVTAILIWFFIFLIHLLNVFLVHAFMNKKWQNEQMDKLVAKQKDKIAQMQIKVEQQHPLPQEKRGPYIKPNEPLNP
ncbi:MAG: hypothetical protein CL868_12580 [Cytophagaceae bacterium]|nr:hypothetical protein [Cytophagaceae bacterium]|tara:strand:+ start:3305 stop:3733 length:429 start_codon:yes stop_codon:yes gene_type:complete